MAQFLLRADWDFLLTKWNYVSNRWKNKQYIFGGQRYLEKNMSLKCKWTISYERLIIQGD